MEEVVIYITTDKETKQKLKTIGKRNGRTEKRPGEQIIKEYIKEYEDENGIIEL